jgi:ankyrin repeat protein
VFRKVLYHANDARLNERNPKTGMSAIHIICDGPGIFDGDRDKSYKEASVKLRALLQRKVNSDVTTHEGMTAFLLASVAGFAEAFDISLEYGADISIMTESGVGVVAAGTTSGSLRSLETLRQFSAPVDWTKTFHSPRYPKGYLGPSGCSVLHAAAMNDNPVVLNYIAGQVKLSSELDDPTEYGFTPLHIAASHVGGEKSVEFLLQKCANKDAKTSSAKMTPLFLAVYFGCRGTIIILLDAGAWLATDTSSEGHK